ncbi:MAG: hypothetical protein ACR2GB_09045 [Nocardioidaceae bacterium]
MTGYADSMWSRLPVFFACAVLALSACSAATSESGSAGDESRSQSSDGGKRHAHAADAATSSQPRWVVLLGDSFISGEGARWAGNTLGPASSVDALGRTAYLDNSNGAAPRSCHRANVSAAFGVTRVKNLACSGAITTSTGRGADFTPGLDFFHDGMGHLGQASALQRFATHHVVSDVAISIGGNDFGFSSVVTRCITGFIWTVGSEPSYCHDDRQLSGAFSAVQIDKMSLRIERALRRVGSAMHRAGYQASDYRIVVQNYPSPLPPGKLLRYPETLQGRYVRGGCPVYDEDATWAHSIVTPAINAAVSSAVEASQLTNLALLDFSSLLDGHRVCETGSRLVTSDGVDSWRPSPGARLQLEWVNRLHVSAAPWQLQESLHPNYWGVRAMRRCLAEATSQVRAALEPCAKGGSSVSKLRGRPGTLTLR